MLTSIRAAQFGDLREKARIYVSSGRWLMGCLDELAVLEQGQCFVQVSNPSPENCFVKHGSDFLETKRNLQVIKGLVVVAKNPCLHPGDVRILEAVDVPSLHHLYDCLVFPQKGDRPHGSDLDGDLYFVTWDENLIPPGKASWTAMDYSPAEAKELPRDVRIKNRGGKGKSSLLDCVIAEEATNGIWSWGCNHFLWEHKLVPQGWDNGGEAESSASGGKASLDSDEQKYPCPCNLTIKTTQTQGKNHKRKYLTCPASKSGGEDCGFYSFLDELMWCRCGKGYCRNLFKNKNKYWCCPLKDTNDCGFRALVTCVQDLSHHSPRSL